MQDNLNISDFFEVIGDIVKSILKLLFIRIPLTILSLLFIIGGLVLTVLWISFVFGSVVGVVLLLIFCLDCFLLPLPISAFGLILLVRAWE